MILQYRKGKHHFLTTKRKELKSYHIISQLAYSDSKRKMGVELTWSPDSYIKASSPRKDAGRY